MDMVHFVNKKINSDLFSYYLKNPVVLFVEQIPLYINYQVTEREKEHTNNSSYGTYFIITFGMDLASYTWRYRTKIRAE